MESVTVEGEEDVEAEELLPGEHRRSRGTIGRLALVWLSQSRGVRNRRETI